MVLLGEYYLELLLRKIVLLTRILISLYRFSYLAKESGIFLGDLIFLLEGGIFLNSNFNS